MKKLLQNRKGLSEFVLDIFSYLVFIIAIFFFLLLFKLQSTNATQREIIEIKVVQSSSITLLNYLRTHVNVNGNEMDMAELIRLWYLEPDKYRVILETSSVDILNKMEYEYDNPNADNIVVRGFYISINSKKEPGNYLISFQSQNHKGGSGAGLIGVVTADQFIPVSDDKTLYLMMFESYKAK